LLSALWLFAMLNYLYADVLSLMDPILLPQWLAGKVEGLTITRPLLFGAALMMEVPIAMTLLSRVLAPRANRLANTTAGIFKTLAVAASLLFGAPNLHYVFFASIELATTLAITFVAASWTTSLPHPPSSGAEAA
ncbi:MAG TPA: DUF6326 family protein, partial [Polyangiaceae bacterium]|nr:DUF6326 family protein [Polyangiaceae bacterium]